MGPPPVSVVVASLGRPRDLDRCLTGLRQLTYRPFEIVAVACEGGRRAAARHADAPFIRVVANRGTGIGAARNDGIAAAGGDIVAFIDDDAVPEPTWLDHLVDAMVSTGSSAVTGFVRGRNGISFQWRGRTVRRDAFIENMPHTGWQPHVPFFPSGATMLEGTGMAVRRDVLLRLGGFDPAFRFYLDDADLSVRLQGAGHRAAIAPLAQVHHAFAASPRRRADRMPTDLRDVGRSLALFIRAHLGAPEVPRVLALHRDAERRRLLRYMVSGHGEPRDVAALLETFDSGADEGLRETAAQPRTLQPEDAAPRFCTDPARPPCIVAGRSSARRALRREAADAVRAGQTVSLFLFSPTTLYHRVRFDAAGFWEQSGGIFGRAERTEPVLRFGGFAGRLAREIVRIAKVRGLPKTRA
jgi:GT2 family glycosyltransferase